MQTFSAKIITHISYWGAVVCFGLLDGLQLWLLSLSEGWLWGSRSLCTGHLLVEHLSEHKPLIFELSGSSFQTVSHTFQQNMTLKYWELSSYWTYLVAVRLWGCLAQLSFRWVLSASIRKSKPLSSLDTSFKQLHLTGWGKCYCQVLFSPREE